MSPTYELIDSITLSSAQSSVLFSNISQNYDDIKIIVSGRSTSTSETDGQSVLYCRFNGTDYSISRRHLYSTGASVASGATSNTNRFLITGLVNSNASYTANTFSSCEINIPNYTSSQNKSISATVMLESNRASTVYMERSAGLVPLTNPISSLEFYPSLGSLASGSTFELYGIKNADDGSKGYFGPAARGGDEVYTTGDGYKVHVFKNSGTLEVTAPGEVEYLVIAGGGAGGLGTSGAGGGGAGGYLTGFINLNIGQKMVIIGAGGVGGTDPYTFTSGNNSSMDTITSIGGGLGMVGYAGSYTGGSGGGGAAGNAGSLGVSGQGNSGGDGSEIYPTRSTRSGGGGGGAGGAGVNGGLSSPGVGGPGRYSSLSNSTLAYGGTGSLGESSNVAASGSQNTGNGGGSSAVYGSGSTGSGGSGIVIIRYKV